MVATGGAGFVLRLAVRAQQAQRGLVTVQRSAGRASGAIARARSETVGLAAASAVSGVRARNAGRAVRKFSVDARFASGGVRRLRDSVRRTSNSLNGLRRVAAFAFGGFLAHSGLRRLNEALNLQVGLRNRLNASGLAAADAEQVFNILNETSRVTGQTVDRLGHTFTRFSIGLTGTGVAATRIATAVDTLTKLSVSLGAHTREVGGAMLQLSQALASGELRGQEFNSVIEAMPVLLQEVARVMGVSFGELRRLSYHGAITSDILLQAIENLRSSVNETFNDFEATFGLLVRGIFSQAIRVLDNFLVAFLGGFEVARSRNLGWKRVLDDISLVLKEIAEDYSKTERIAVRLREAAKAFWIIMELGFKRVWPFFVAIGKAVVAIGRSIFDWFQQGGFSRLLTSLKDTRDGIKEIRDEAEIGSSVGGGVGGAAGAGLGAILGAKLLPAVLFGIPGIGPILAGLAAIGGGYAGAKIGGSLGSIGGGAIAGSRTARDLLSSTDDRLGEVFSVEARAGRGSLGEELKNIFSEAGLAFNTEVEKSGDTFTQAFNKILAAWNDELDIQAEQRRGARPLEPVPAPPFGLKGAQRDALRGSLAPALALGVSPEDILAFLMLEFLEEGVPKDFYRDVFRTLGLDIDKVSRDVLGRAFTELELSAPLETNQRNLLTRGYLVTGRSNVEVERLIEEATAEAQAAIDEQLMAFESALAFFNRGVIAAGEEFQVELDRAIEVVRAGLQEGITAELSTFSGSLRFISDYIHDDAQAFRDELGEAFDEVEDIIRANLGRAMLNVIDQITQTAANIAGTPGLGEFGGLVGTGRNAYESAFGQAIQAGETSQAAAAAAAQASAIAVGIQVFTNASNAAVEAFYRHAELTQEINALEQQLLNLDYTKVGVEQEYLAIQREINAVNEELNMINQDQVEAGMALTAADEALTAALDALYIALTPVIQLFAKLIAVVASILGIFLIFEGAVRELIRIITKYIPFIPEVDLGGRALIERGQKALREGGSVVFTGEGSGFQRGGFTGYGLNNEIAGLVHRNEFVLPPDVTRAFLRGASVSVSDGESRETPVSIVNVVDPSMVGDYLGTRQGQQQIVNIIRSNAPSIRSAIG